MIAITFVFCFTIYRLDSGILSHFTEQRVRHFPEETVKSWRREGKKKDISKGLVSVSSCLWWEFPSSEMIGRKKVGVDRAQNTHAGPSLTWGQRGMDRI